MSTDLVIRTRADSDLPRLAAVLKRVYDLDGYPVEGVSDPTAWLRHPRTLRSWAASLANEPIGQITLTGATEQDDAAKIWRDHTGGNIADLAIPVRLFVDPECRGVGAGRLLMATALDYAHTHGHAVAFDVMTKDQEAIRLYEKLGARKLAEITHVHSGGREEPAAVYMIPRPQ